MPECNIDMVNLWCWTHGIGVDPRTMQGERCDKGEAEHEDELMNGYHEEAEEIDDEHSH